MHTDRTAAGLQTIRIDANEQDMSALDTLAKHALPKVLADATAVSGAGPIDLGILDGVALFDLCDHDRLTITGRDRVRFLHAMLSNDVKTLTAGEGRWLTFNDIRGKTVADVRLFVVDPERKTGSMFALLEPGAAELFIEGLDKYLISEKVFFEPAPGGLWLVAGTEASTALEARGATLPEEGLYRHVETTIGDQAVRILRIEGATGADYAVYSEDSALPSALTDLPVGTRNQLEAARILAGRPRHGIDFHTDHIPLEAGLSNLAISFTKGCYIGQEVICRIDSMGEPKRRLTQLDMTGVDAAPAPGTPLLVNGKTVGFTTSAFLGNDGPHALGYVKKKKNAVGATLTLGSDGPTVSIARLVGRMTSQDR